MNTFTPEDIQALHKHVNRLQSLRNAKCDLPRWMENAASDSLVSLNIVNEMGVTWRVITLSPIELTYTLDREITALEDYLRSRGVAV